MFFRLFELCFSICILLVFSPLFVLMFLFVDDPIYIQRRVGRDGRSFNVFKFRTMVKNGDHLLEAFLDDHYNKEVWETAKKLKNDPRVTKIGHYLRKWSLDEIPQFINVIFGDMNIVGPRPLIEHELKDYHGKYYSLMKPGITGLWQIFGHRGPFSKRARYDDIYYLKRSVLLDLTIIFRTPFAMISNV